MLLLRWRHTMMLLRVTFAIAIRQAADFHATLQLRAARCLYNFVC